MAIHRDKEFKQRAVQYRLDNPDLSVVACAKNLGVAVSSLHAWLRSAKENEGSVKHIGSGNTEDEYKREIERLKRENKAQADALDILKKAMSILGEDVLK